MKDAQELTLGTEIPQGTLEQTVTVKIGDNLDAMMGAEILLEDGKIVCVSSIMKHNDFITIGVIIAPHGVRGDLRIMPRTDFPERFMHMDACYIDGKEYHVASARFHKQFVLASFKEIPDRNAAELFAKKEIQVRREDFGRITRRSLLHL